MVTKIISTLQDMKRTTRSRIVCLIGDEIIKTKYDDIGRARESLKALREIEKHDENLKVIDKSRIGIVVEEHTGKTEKELVKISLKQVKDVIDTLNKESGGIRSKIEVFEEINGVWVEK